MIPTKDQHRIIHAAAAEFAVAHYREPTLPKASAILIAGEAFAEAQEFSTENDERAPFYVEMFRDAFVRTARKLLLILRDETEPGGYR